ncbi:MAG: ferrochelatase [bacterium]
MTHHTTAVLLVNLGSPDSYTPKDLRQYLDEFLMDRYVIDLPYLLRTLLVKGIILNTRPKKSAAAYKSIWWDEGSPLIVLSKRLQKALTKRCPYPVGLGMRYANPSIKDGIAELLKQHPKINDIILLPLYPHYAMATTLTVLEKTREVLRQFYPGLRCRYIPPFYKDPLYISALASSIKRAVNIEEIDHLLFSFHGIPERHVKKTDPTRAHCMRVNNCCYSPSTAHQQCYSHHVHYSAQLCAREAGIPDSLFSISFQSRLGLDRWLSPATDERIVHLAKSGVKRLAILCPAFVSDCLETLEEIGEEAKESFLDHGGETFTLIPCLNTDQAFIDCLSRLIQDDALHMPI